jgi:hypothetical protein
MVPLKEKYLIQNDFYSQGTELRGNLGTNLEVKPKLGLECCKAV